MPFDSIENYLTIKKLANWGLIKNVGLKIV